MANRVTYELEGIDKQLEDRMLRAIGSGSLKMFEVGADGSRTEVYLSEADHSQGHSDFDPRDARKDKHGPHKAGHKHRDNSVSFTIAPVPPSGAP